MDTAQKLISEAVSFYKRPLSDKLVPFSSPEGMKLFTEALASGFLHNYFFLAEQFTT